MFENCFNTSDALRHATSHVRNGTLQNASIRFDESWIDSLVRRRTQRRSHTFSLRALTDANPIEFCNAGAY
jgi:hypothetical protein